MESYLECSRKQSHYQTIITKPRCSLDGILKGNQLWAYDMPHVKGWGQRFWEEIGKMDIVHLVVKGHIREH